MIDDGLSDDGVRVLFGYDDSAAKNTHYVSYERLIVIKSSNRA